MEKEPGEEYVECSTTTKEEQEDEQEEEEGEAQKLPKTANELKDLTYFLPENPDFIPLEQGQRLVAIGDIHGNLELLLGCLKAGNLVDGHSDWAGGNTVCVQVGDVLDRGTQELECLRLLCKLAQQAPMAGGAVVLLWGNHEVENACGNFGHTCADDSSFRKEFGSLLQDLKGRSNWSESYDTGHANRWAVLEPGGLLAEPLLSKLKVAVRVGRSVLVHGGLTEEQLTKNGGIAGMNRLAKEWITTPLTTNPEDAEERASNIVSASPQFLQSFPSHLSPLWMRTYSLPSNREPMERSAKAKIDSVLDALENVDRLVVGHTIQTMINSIWDGKVWRIDVGQGAPFSENRSCVSCAEVLQVSCDAEGTETVTVMQRPINNPP